VRLSRGEIEALYRAHGHAVYRRALRLLQNEDDARDVLHDVFVELQRKGERFEGKSSIATYLYSMTTHACLNWLRNRRTRARLLAGYRPGPEFIPARGERRALAVELLAQLSPDDAALAIYLHCDELTHDEIAALRGCSRRHVGDLAARLQRQLQEKVA
jgi:RNA polymerase sigma-70 factor (ECF subfamily)